MGALEPLEWLTPGFSDVHAHLHVRHSQLHAQCPLPPCFLANRNFLTWAARRSAPSETLAFAAALVSWGLADEV